MIQNAMIMKAMNRNETHRKSFETGARRTKLRGARQKRRGELLELVLPLAVRSIRCSGHLRPLKLARLTAS